MGCDTKNYGAEGSHPAEIITQDENHRFVTDAQIQQWNDGTDGRSLFKALAFRRSATVPDTPTGGSFNLPIPDGGLWTNTPLPGLDPLFVSTRLFTNDGEPPQEAGWTPPVLFVQHGAIGNTGPKGEDGADGLPGAPGAPGLNGADGVDGSDGTSIRWIGEAASHPLNPINGDAYRNTTDKKSYVYQDDAWYQMTIDGTDGQDGANGADGVDGVDGTSIVWQGEFASHPANPQDGWSYRNTTDKKSYVYQSGAWYQMTVDGVDGANGTDGLSIIWKGESSNPPANPEVNWAYRDLDNGRIYIWDGTAWDLMVLDGSDGADGAAGSDGLSVYVTYHDADPAGAAPSPPTSINGDDNGWHTNPTSASSWISQKIDDGTTNNWGAAIRIKGQDGTNGTDGLSIVWKGNLATPPADPELNWAYRDTSNYRVYIWNGVAWELMVLDGSDGADGADGTDGLSVYITYHDADPTGNPPTLPTNAAGTDNGWHTDATSAVGWMSQKIDDGTGAGWGNPIPIRGSNGASGPRGSGIFSIDESDAGTDYITPATAVSWAGTLTDAEAKNVARDIIGVPPGTGFSSDGYLRPNDKITVSDDSNQVVGTRVFLGLPTQDYTTVLASDFGSLVTNTVDGGLIVNGTVSAGALAADVLSVSNLLAGVITLGDIFIGSDAQIELDGANQSIDVRDGNGTLRVRFGKTGAGLADWGHEIYASDGSTILDAGGVSADKVSGLGDLALVDQINIANRATYLETGLIDTLYLAGNAVTLPIIGTFASVTGIDSQWTDLVWAVMDSLGQPVGFNVTGHFYQKIVNFSNYYPNYPTLTLRFLDGLGQAQEERIYQCSRSSRSTPSGTEYTYLIDQYVSYAVGLPGKNGEASYKIQAKFSHATGEFNDPTLFAIGLKR